MKLYNVYFNNTLLESFDTLEAAIQYIEGLGYPEHGRYYIQ